MKTVIGFDIGGTKCAVSLGRTDGGSIEIADKCSFPTRSVESPTAVLELLEQNMRQMCAAQGIALTDIHGIGISCGGPLDSERGIILSPPNLPGWDHIEIKRYFEERTSIPTFLQNDADACALAEWKFGAGQGCRNMVFLTFGTGFGAGLILNGALYSGSTGAAGEIGHCRAPQSGYAPVGYGKAGSFEGFCSGGGIAQLGRSMVMEQLQMGIPVSFCSSMAELDSLTAKSIADAANGGDPLALSIYRCSGQQLGAALSLLIDLLNPDAVVIGSVYARSEDLLRDSAMEVIRRETLSANRQHCRILPATLGEQLGDIAALSVAL